MTAALAEMFQTHSSCPLFLKFLIVLLLLSWRVEAKFVNNKTLIKIINDMKSSWIAGENDMVLPREFMTLRPRKKAIPTLKVDNVDTPKTFDARKHFKACRSVIRNIREQGKCESCWAMAASSMLSDRICIESRGGTKVQLSAEDVITCCKHCRASGTNSCKNAYPADAIYFWIKEGIVTENRTKKQMGCKPYSEESYKGKNVECRKSCTNKQHFKEYDEDKRRGKLVYQIEPNEKAIKSEIFLRGPVVAVIELYEDFLNYNSGVYRQKKGERKGHHSFKIIGWGEEDDHKYWLISNSWGRKFGTKGYAKFLRGQNHCKIEDNVVAGRVAETLSVREAIKKAETKITATSSANTRSLSSVGMFLLQALSIWTLRRTLSKCCL